MRINDINLYEKRRRNTCGVEIMDSRDKRISRITLLSLRKNVGHFSSRRVHLESGLERTIRHNINKLGFYYLRSRKKKEGLALCKRLRTKFCRNITRTRLGPGFRTHSINLYLDRMGFVYKKN